MKKVKLMQGDNMESFKKLPDNSIDSVVTDPPYGLGKERDMNIILKDWIEKGYSEIEGTGFMGKEWDAYVPQPQFWKEVFRVLKPGGHILAFFGTRTYDIGTMAIRLAGFEIRDQIQWIYGSGFPKSHNIGKAVDKLEGNEREVVGVEERQLKNGGNDDWLISDKKRENIDYTITKGTSPYEGWGTALKPANEPICVARKPLSEKSVAENVLKWGTGGINVDGCRVGYIDDNDKKSAVPGGKISYTNESWGQQAGLEKDLQDKREAHNEGRFPANIILECICDEVIKGEKGEIKIGNGRDKSTHEYNSVVFNGSNEVRNGSKRSISYAPDNYNDKGDTHTDPNCPCRLLDEQSGESKSNKGVGNRKPSKNDIIKWSNTFENGLDEGYNDKGGASRFFYQAKVSKAERNMGLDGFEEKESEQKGHGLDRVCMNEGCGVSMLKPENCKCEEPDWRPRPKKNSHPTVKPINLMAYLCRLITPEGGIVLDPFMGSGSTGVAAQLEGFRFVGMEMDSDYFKIAEARINSYEKYKKFKK